MSVVSITGLHKSYGAIKALNNVTFDVPESSVFGILGPNGSGKTTLLGILLNVLNADGGTYSWLGGVPHDAARRQIGALLETPNFYHYLNADENLAITAGIKQRGGDDITRVLGLVGLLERRKSKFSTYSLGMKQRLAIGAALLGRPKILVLDEPTNGLDPAGIAEIRELIRQLAKEGITVIMASHLLDEVEKVCTHMAILKRGQLLVTGSVEEVLQASDMIQVQARDNTTLKLMLQQMPGIGEIRMTDDLLTFSATDAITPLAVNQYCASNGIILSHLVLKKKSLESKFIELTAGGPVA